MEAMVAVEAVAKAVAKGVVETTQEQREGSNPTKVRGLCNTLGPMHLTTVTEEPQII